MPPVVEMPDKPKKRGKPPEQYAAELAAYQREVRAYFAAMALAKREKFASLGIKKYEWLAVDVHGCCHVAAKNGGKVFSVTEAPPEGHVGEGECSSPDWCRCIASPVVEFGA